MPLSDPLKALNYLTENKNVFLRPLGSSEWDKSRVEAFLRDFICVAHPQTQGRLKKFSPQDKLEIGFSVEGDFYTFLSVILRIPHKPLPILVLTRPTPDELINVKRRLSPRVDTLVPLTYEVLAGPAFDSSHNTLARNLSSTGLSFNTPHPISAGQGLRLDFQIPNATLGLTARGEVVSCQKVVTSQLERYKIRVKFLSISKLNQERIEDYVRDKTQSRERLR
jgi:c-di-GMP-binding flagellar brake protein YcgR